MDVLLKKVEVVVCYLQLLHQWEAWLRQPSEEAHFKVNVNSYLVMLHSVYKNVLVISLFSNIEHSSVFLGCGNGNAFASNTSNTLTAMLSHPGSVDVLDGTPIPGIASDSNLIHQNSSNTLSPFTIAKHTKTLKTQHSYQGNPSGHNHSRTASMTASMEVAFSSFIHYLLNLIIIL